MNKFMKKRSTLNHKSDSHPKLFYTLTKGDCLESLKKNGSFICPNFFF